MDKLENENIEEVVDTEPDVDDIDTDMDEEIDADSPVFNLEDRDNEFYREPSVLENVLDWVRDHLIGTFIIIGIILVILIVYFIPRIASSSNPVKAFVESSSNLVYKGGFDFDLSVTYDGEEYMTYEGSAEFNQSSQEVYSSYSAVYPEYTYENFTYTDRDKEIYFGNHFNGKWNISLDTHMVTDFYDFLRDFKEGRFDANAFMSFYSKTGEFVPTELNKAVNNTLRKLGAGSGSILHMEKTKSGDNTVYRFNPDMGQVMDIVLDNSKSALKSADKYEEFRTRVEMNRDVIEKSKLAISFTVDKSGNMSEFHWDFVTNGKSYRIDMTVSNVGNPSVKIPQTFFDQCGIPEKDIKQKYFVPDETVSETETETESETETAAASEATETVNSTSAP